MGLDQHVLRTDQFALVVLLTVITEIQANTLFTLAIAGIETCRRVLESGFKMAGVLVSAAQLVGKLGRCRELYGGL